MPKELWHGSLTSTPAVCALCSHYNSNVHRGVHYLSAKATTAYEEARAKVARFINASSDREVVFTRNASEAINLVAQTWGMTHLKAGDEVRTTASQPACQPASLPASQLASLAACLPACESAFSTCANYCAAALSCIARACHLSPVHCPQQEAATQISLRLPCLLFDPSDS